MTSANETGLLKKQARAAKWKSYVFPTVMLAYPVVQVLIFYFGVNINGNIIDSAFTVCFDDRFKPLLDSAREATRVGIKTAGKDGRLLRA